MSSESIERLTDEEFYARGIARSRYHDRLFAESRPRPTNEQFDEGWAAAQAYYQRVVKELEAEPERLPGILREQRDTIKHWQQHALITSRLLGCIAIDKDIETAISALKHQPSLSDAIKEVEKYRNDQNEALKRELVLRESAYEINRLNCVVSTANNLLEQLKSLGPQRED